MNQYERRMVNAPKWMEDFSCIADRCTDSCCQQWNIEVDPVHAECYTDLGDPDLQPIMDRLLHRFYIRRVGMRKPERQYRLLLLNEPDKRCPLLDETGKCRLQKKYGADILCDTCYFHPRTFWQIDDKTGMSVCLSCPECARLALLHEEPTVFSVFEAEIDPGAEWLETSLISDPDTGMLMQNRDLLIGLLVEILQNRGENDFSKRMKRAESFLNALAETKHPDEQAIRDVFELISRDPLPNYADEDPYWIIQYYLDIIDPINESLEKAAQGTMEITRLLAGGRNGFLNLLSQNYEAGSRILEPFFKDRIYLIENFMVHCVFSDSFKQFYRCQNEALTAADILRHEASLLKIWYLLLRVVMSGAALREKNMTEEIFIRTIIQADKTFWHYPDWLSRCAERMMEVRS